MILKRVLHPVGHGAFFTEQFFEYDGEIVFNVVYDCGIIYKGKNWLEKEIDESFSQCGRPHVDFLFISHLDEDHVNGIKYMVKKKYVDDQTTFVLPLYKDYELKIYEELEGRAVLSIYDVISQTKSTSVFYVPLTDIESESGDEESGNNLSTLDMENLPEPSDNNTVTVNGLKGIVINKRERFEFREIWEYIPFNLHDSTSRDFFNEISNSKILSALDLQRVNDIFINKCSPRKKVKTDAEKDANKKYNELKKIYNKVGKSVKGDRRININSLAVISQAVNEADINVSLLSYERMLAEGFCRRCCFEWTYYGHGSCTYSGDLNLVKDKDFDIFERKISAALRGDKKYHLMQIPHHGSETSYNKRCSGGLSGSCFVNFHSEKTKFFRQILFDFFCARKRLIPITEIESSKFEQEFRIG